MNFRYGLFFTLFVLGGAALISLMYRDGAVGVAARSTALLVVGGIILLVWLMSRGVRRFGEEYFASSSCPSSSLSPQAWSFGRNGCQLPSFWPVEQPSTWRQPSSRLGS
jgi:hypothetical protein